MAAWYNMSVPAPRVQAGLSSAAVTVTDGRRQLASPLVRIVTSVGFDGGGLQHHPGCGAAEAGCCSRLTNDAHVRWKATPRRRALPCRRRRVLTTVDVQASQGQTGQARLRRPGPHHIISTGRTHTHHERLCCPVSVGTILRRARGSEALHFWSGGMDPSLLFVDHEGLKSAFLSTNVEIKWRETKNGGIGAAQIRKGALPFVL